MSSTQCCENPPTLDSSCGEGSLTEVGGLKAYVTGPPHSKRALIFASDIFGSDAPSLRLLADKVAASGFYVVVPDFFFGEPFSGDPFAPDKPLEVWLKSHGMDKGFEDAKPLIAALRSKGAETIGAAGFCWGAKVVVELAKSDYIQAAVILHPYQVTVDDVKEVKAPIAVLGAEFDIASPPELLKQFEEVLSSKTEINSYVKIFPGVRHGWTIRYKNDDEKEVKSAEESHRDLLDWFVEYVK